MVSVNCFRLCVYGHRLKLIRTAELKKKEEEAAVAAASTRTEFDIFARFCLSI
jgi:hypothetical protein